MKTHIIQLESLDDIHLVRDQITWGQTGRILLVWPNRREPVLNRQLDLVLLQRHSANLGTQLSLVTNDLEVKFYAEKLEIPVFKTRREAEENRWRGRRRPKRSATIHDYDHQRPKKSLLELLELREKVHPPVPTWIADSHTRITFFSLGILAVLVMGLVLLPSAQVTLIPDSKTQELTFTAISSPSIKAINASGAIPTRLLSVVVEGREIVDATGTIERPVSTATGTVQFTNQTDRTVAVPIGTIVHTREDEPVEFATTQSASLPLGEGESVEITIEARIPGTNGNAPADSIQAIKGTLNTDLTVTNPNITTGGAGQILHVPSQQDRSLAFDQLLKTLQGSAMKEIQEMIKFEDVLLTQTPVLSDILEESYTPAEFEPNDSLEIKLQLSFQASLITKEDLVALARLVLDTRLEKGFSPIESTLSVKLISEPELGSDSTARLQVQSERIIQAPLDQNQAINMILGQPLKLSVDRLTNGLLLYQPPTIKVSPSWWPRMPFLAFRIDVRDE